MAEFNTLTKLGDRLVMKQLVEDYLHVENFVDYSIKTFGNGTDKVSILRSNPMIKTISLPNATTIAAYTLEGCSAEYVSLPKATRIDRNAFNNCRSLTSVYLPKVTQMSYEAFMNASALESISLPELTNYNYLQRCFQGCTALVSAHIPKLTRADSNFFRNCTSLQNVDMPLMNLCYGIVSGAVNGGQDFFNGCSSLKRLYLPSQTASLSLANIFAGCDALEVLRFPALTGTISNSTCLGTKTNMKLLDLGLTTAIDQAINTLPYTKILILRKTDAIVTLADTSVFTSDTTPSPIKVYVPLSLISSYETETNWSSIKGTYVSFIELEGSPYEQTDFDDSTILATNRSAL